MRLGNAILAILLASVGSSAQAPRQVDIGAAQAPLSDAERVDLQAAVTKHNYPAEKAVFDKALKEHPDSYELLIMAGRLAYLERHPDDAADALAKAAKVKPLTEQDQMTLALANEFSNKPADARNEMLRLTKLDPKNAEYIYFLGRIDRQNQNLEAAEQDFAKTVAVNPKFMRAYEDLGQVQEELGGTEKARKTYELAAVENRGLKRPWEWSPVDLGAFLLKSNDYENAEKLFREALQYNPRFGWAHYYMGRVFEKKQRNVEAINEFQAAVVSEPKMRQAWLALGQLFSRSGNKEQANRCINIFKELEAQENAAKRHTNLDYLGNAGAGSSAVNH